jgi:hypothetical protein
MTEAELVALWEERAAIIEEGCQSDPFWKHRSADWRRHEAERLAYWDLKRTYGIERMPRQCWREKRDAAG